MTMALGVPAHVRAASFDSATVIVDYRTGAVIALTGITAQTWCAAAAGSAGKPLPIHDRLRAQGLLAPGERPRPPIRGKEWSLSFGTEEYAAGTAHGQTAVGLTDGVLGALALALTLGARSAGRNDRAMTRLLRLLVASRRLVQVRARSAEAAQAVTAVRSAARWMPVRVACLEESVGAVVFLALRGRSVTWCHGVATDPYCLHAWIECDGRPVAEPASTSRYTILRTMPEES